MLLVGGFGLVSAAAIDCESNPEPVGYHSPNIVWNGRQFAVAWANRGEDNKVMFGVMGTKGWETRPTRVTRYAFDTDPPLIHSNGDSFVLAWTHDARRKAGLYVRELSAAGKGRREQQIAEGPVSLCRQLVWADGAYSLAWMTETGVFLGRVDPSATTPTIPTEIDSPIDSSPETEGLTDCRLAWSGQHYGLVLAERTQAGKHTLQFLTLDASREVVGRSVVAGSDATIRPQELVWTGSAFVLAYTIDGQPGASMARLTADAEPEWRGSLPGTNGFVRGVGIGASTPVGVIWTETATADDMRGHIYLGLMPTEGQLDQRTQLTDKPSGRFVVNAMGAGDRLGIGWSIDIPNGSAVRWRGISFEQSARDVDTVSMVIDSDATSRRTPDGWHSLLSGNTCEAGPQ